MYPVMDEADYEIEDYRVVLIKEDHDRYNPYYYLGIINNKNKKDDLEITKTASKNASTVKDTSDIDELEHMMDTLFASMM